MPTFRYDMRPHLDSWLQLTEARIKAIERIIQEELGFRQAPAEPTTISVGACVVHNACFLTDREAEERANRAKNYAKAHGKNCIATYEGELFRDEDIRIVAPRERVAAAPMPPPRAAELAAPAPGPAAVRLPAPTPARQLPARPPSRNGLGSR
jgi:hypothetical protein